MIMLTVTIDDKKTEKAIKAILDAFDLDCKSDQAIFDRLKKSAEEIKLYKEGKIKFQDAAEF